MQEKDKKENTEPIWQCPEPLSWSRFSLGAFDVESVKHKNRETHRVILQLHGGGFEEKIKNIYRRFAARYAEIADADVLTPDYRIAPKYRFPTALKDVIFTYRWLLSEGGYAPSNLVIAGDSAGGGLALSLCHYIREQKLPLPAAVITMSAWTDLSLSGDSHKTNFEKDAIFGNSRDNILYRCTYVGDADKRDPYLSPIYGNFEEFPPILMQVGGAEVLLDDTLRVAEKIRKKEMEQTGRDEVDTVSCTVYEDMFHVFQMGMNLFSESRKAWEEVEQFLRKIYQIPNSEDIPQREIRVRSKGVEDRMKKNLIAFLKMELNETGSADSDSQ